MVHDKAKDGQRAEEQEELAEGRLPRHHQVGHRRVQ
jgi:hypothetical protein